MSRAYSVTHGACRRVTACGSKSRRRRQRIISLQAGWHSVEVQQSGGEAPVQPWALYAPASLVASYGIG
eukprot:6175791-Pleurochrysis_carterae.AAC.5